MTEERSLERVFKAYDVRGVVPDDLDVTRVFAIGAGFARFVADRGERHVLLARDMRESSIELSRAFINGAVSKGATVTDIGLCSTDLLYFASGRLDSPGVMLTASHNPARYNGMKFCLSRARPIGQESGLSEIRQYAEEILERGGIPSFFPDPDRSSVTERDLLPEFVDHVHSFVDQSSLKPLSIVADTANGMGGLIAPRVFEGLPFSLEVLFGDLDGNFPNHPADPIQEENLKDLKQSVVRNGADVGLAFDGDADRVFLVDERGVAISGSTTTAIVAHAMLKKNPGATVLYNCICSKTVPEVIAESGGIGVRTRVGHSFIKSVMAETDAVFGGEHSGHYYFSDNYRADSGIIAALVVLEELSLAGVPLSELRRPFERYANSGERNSVVDDPAAIVGDIAVVCKEMGASIDFLDGLTADFSTWWFNLRPSNTEPLLRLNLEAADAESLAARVEDVEDLISHALSKGKD